MYIIKRVEKKSSIFNPNEVKYEMKIDNYVHNS